MQVSLKIPPENNSLCLHQGRRYTCKASFCTGKGSLRYPVCVTNSVKDMQRAFRRRYRKDPPHHIFTYSVGSLEAEVMSAMARMKISHAFVCSV
jgi:hypothetical protein